MPNLQVPLTSPIKGVVRSIPREGQPQETCWDALNCLPYDRYGRKRLAQRPGISKQFASPLAANFIQGMIEAPNIIYPPNTGPAGPVYSIAQNTGWPTGGVFGIGTGGPFGYAGPSFSLSSTWEWTFNSFYNASITPTGSGWFAVSEFAEAVFYFPLTSTASETLILIVDIQCDMADSFSHGGGKVGSVTSANLKYGDPLANPNTWVQLGTLNGDGPWNPTADCLVFLDNLQIGASVGQASDFTLTITSAGVVTLTQTSGDGSPVSVTLPFTPTIYPDLNCLSVELDADHGGGHLCHGFTHQWTITDV